VPDGLIADAVIPRDASFMLRSPLTGLRYAEYPPPGHLTDARLKVAAATYGFAGDIVAVVVLEAENQYRPRGTDDLRARGWTTVGDRDTARFRSRPPPAVSTNNAREASGSGAESDRRMRPEPL
jgi:hypothetical protein